MAFDGITVAGIVRELKDTIEGGGISRIIQPEKDELLLQIKSHKTPYLLLMSANASLPLIYLTDTKKEAPLTAPNFCMLLRKHIQGGQIVSVTQPSLERLIVLEISHRDELGDLRTKKLIIELMGKYSNIIFTDENNMIIDSIKRVPASVSSVREVLPGKTWFIPEQAGRKDLLSMTSLEELASVLGGTSQEITRAVSQSFIGIAPIYAEEMVFEAGIDARKTWQDLTALEQASLCSVLLEKAAAIRNGEFAPHIVLKNDEPVEFGMLPYRMYAHEPYSVESCESAGDMIRNYYGAKERLTRIRQKSADLRHVTSTALDRINKKFQLQEKQLKSTEKKDKYRIWGEMLNTYGYSAEDGASSLTCLNYYDNTEITVPLDPTLSTSENAQKYFARYNKLKRTAEAMDGQLEETAADREQLESILTAIDLAETEGDLKQIRTELQDFGFVQRKALVKKGAKREEKAAPYSYTSSDGFEILVGRNNYQNEELSFKIAGNSDWWFHAKNAPGSHVIVRTQGREVPDRTFEEAGALAAWYSSKQKAPKVEIDYTLRKNLRKKNGGKPGFVIYHTNYSLMAEPDISALKRNH
ncbi:MAG: NFACT RNA binding domain-containing protein [Lachnospiraceae bacterium]|nr:NFACT RNA binding domain-containing protein [Lachnospiraceae bacterium]